MRSIALVLALAAPLSAVASPNTFTRPTRVHEQKPQLVFMTFVNRTPQDREVMIGNKVFRLRNFEHLNIEAPVGSDVRVYSETNSKFHGQVLMQVSAANQDRDIVLQ